MFLPFIPQSHGQPQGPPPPALPRTRHQLPPAPKTRSHTRPLPCGSQEGKDQVSLVRQERPGRSCIRRRWLGQNLPSTSFTAQYSHSKRQAELQSAPSPPRARPGHLLVYAALVSQALYASVSSYLNGDHSAHTQLPFSLENARRIPEDRKQMSGCQEWGKRSWE